MVRQFYAWAPLVIAGTIILLALPWLGVIALVVFSFVALAALCALVSTVVFAPYLVARSVHRRWHEPSVVRAPVGPAEEARTP